MREKAKSKILIVEDEGVVAKDIQMRLERLGYAIVGIAYSGDEAIEVAGQLSPHLVLMDVKLRGDMDGIEAARQIRDRFNIPVIYLTAYTDDMTLKFAKTAEPYGYIVKPFGDRELHSNISMALYKHKAEKALRESENRYRAVIENAAEGIVVTQDRKLQFVNPQFIVIMGYSEKELTSRPFIEFVHPDHREQVMGIHIKRFKGEEVPSTYEFRVVDKQGNTKWLENKGILIEWGGGPATLNFLRDITERKKAEEVLLESEERYRAVAEDAPVLICRFLHGGEITYVNNAYCRYFEKTVEELVGSSFLSLIPEADREAVMANISALTVESPTQSHEHQVIGPDGEIRWQRWTNRALFDVQGKAVAYQSIGEDITERKRAEEEIIRAKEEWERTFMAVPDLIAIIDKQHRIVRINKAMGERMGVAPDEAVGMVCYECIHGTKEPPNFCPHIKLLADGQEHMEEIYEEHLGGYFIVSVSPLRDDDGSLLGCVHIARDITERKKAEEEREATIGLLHLLNTTNHIHELMKLVTTFLKDWSDCEAVGIRLQDGDDFPYFETSGFPEEFVLAESKLCSVDEAGELVRDSQGRPFLECMCGNIISGRFDPSKPFFTEHGSFWVNSTTELLAGTTEADRLERTRNRCNTAGYESVALVPLRVGKETFGLLQFNDKQKGRFTPEKILLLERLADNLAMGLAQRRAEKALRDSEERFRTSVENMLDCFGIYSSIRDESGRIVDFLVEYVNEAACMSNLMTKEEQIGKRLCELLPSHRETGLFDEYCQVVETGKPLIKESLIYKDIYKRESLKRAFDIRIVKLGDGFAVSWRDVTERKQAEEKLFDYQTKLKSLASQLSLIEERERRQLATDLHDQIGQSLVISKMKLDSLRESVSSGVSTDVLEQVCDSLGQVIQDTRTLTFDLSYPILYELGFEAAVAEWLDEQVQEKHGIKTEFEDDGQPKPLDDDIRVFLFRNVRELLVNIVKHANAQKVKVYIRKVDDQICVTVEDDGVGFDPAEAASKAGFGIFSIRERLEESGGHLEIKSEPGQGSRITMVAPLKSK